MRRTDPAVPKLPGQVASVKRGRVYRLTFRELPSEIPTPVRLRRFLKSLLRWLRFRAVSLEEVR